MVCCDHSWATSPRQGAGASVGLAAMATNDIPIDALGVSDPATWSVSGWAADVVPHLAYGLVTALAYDAFTERMLLWKAA